MSLASEWTEHYRILVQKGFINPKKLSVDEFIMRGGACTCGSGAMRAVGYSQFDENGQPLNPGEWSLQERRAARKAKGKPCR